MTDEVAEAAKAKDAPSARTESTEREDDATPAARDDPLERRGIRSFVLRQGRLSKAQERAWRELLPIYGVPYRPSPLDFIAVFGREAPVVLEIGFGMGETTAQIAAADPSRNYLAVEVHTPGVGNLLKLIDAGQLANVRVLQHDAIEVLTDMLPPASLAGVNIFFPDPWPKKRHHKRRLVQPENVQLVATRLARGGQLHLATDWEEYAQQMLDVLAAEPLLQNVFAGFAPRQDDRPVTKFETRGTRLGHDIREVVFRRG